MTAYLEKIQVDRQIYGEFVTRQRNFNAWDDVPYIDAYTKTFLSSVEYSTKVKQKGYQAKSEEEKLEWCNVSFYEFALAKEAEKLLYYSLAYGQTALIVTAPNDNKGQEKFLGYGWSNRKGQEGIQIKKQGGLLYNPQDRQATDTLAALVRASFGVEEELTGDLGEYYHYMPVTDMLDFSGVNFNKAIKTNKVRHQGVKEGMTAYKLDGREFSVSIGNRVVAAEIEEDGEYPVYSANVFEEFGRINKQNLTDFSKPSVIWGIDGDWMVNYLPENYPFYPTDHCGVIRVNTDKILPKYLALALQVEGEYERFSRSNRASTARIKSLTVQIPGVDVQRKVVEEIDEIDRSLGKLKNNIDETEAELTSLFVEMFYKQSIHRGTLGEYAFYVNEKIGIETIDINHYVTTDNMLKNKKGITIYRGIPQIEVVNKYRRDDVLISNIRPYLKKIWIADYNGGCSNDVLVFRSLDKRKLLPVYLFYALRQDAFFEYMMSTSKGIKMPRGDKKQILSYIIPIPSLEQQIEFEKIVSEKDKHRKNAQEKILKFRLEKKDTIKKYFK